MKAEERRKEMALALLSSKKAISGSELSKMYGVSRQIIVQDISSLKANGYEIISTHNGYMLQNSPLAKRAFKVFHTTEQTENELNIIIDHGGIVFDVFVWHKVYGKMEAKLNISSKQHIKQFIDGVRSGKSSELMNITGGYHYHTVLAQSEEVLNQIEAILREKNYLAPEIKY